MKTTALLLTALLGAAGASALAQGAGTKIWEYPVGTNTDVGSPALGPDGTIYFIGNGSFPGLYAVNSNGNLVAYQHNTRMPDCPTVARDGRVYLADTATLYAYDPTLTSAAPVFTASATIISDIVLGPEGTLYFGAMDYKLYAVNPDGSLKWQYSLPVGTVATSISVSTDGTIYFSSGSKLYALTRSGTKKWAFPSNTYGFAPVARDGTVYVANGALIALYPESTNPNGTKRWQFDLPVEQSFAPVIAADGTIFVSGGNYVLYAVKSNGTKKWEFQAGDRIIYTSAAIGPDGTIYVGSDDHFLYAINPDGSYKWGFETDGQVRSSPIIKADGTIYVGCGGPGNSHGKLYAIRGDASSTYDPWPMLGRDLRRGGRVTCPKGLPCFDTATKLASGPFDVIVVGHPGTNYGLEASTNLQDWSRLTNLASANGAIHFVDDTATNYPNRFYRAATP
jgi:outer membrane protein assembly factor BamB